MVKVVGKMDLDNESEKKLNALKQRIIVIMTKNNKTSLPLGTVLHNADKAKLEIKKSFSQYRIAKNVRKNEKDDFNWVRFFDENLCPEFEVETNFRWDDGKISDALHYHPQNEANQIVNIAVIQSSQKDDALKQEQIIQKDVISVVNNNVKEEQIVINKE